MSFDKPILVCGSAHLDVLSQVTGDPAPIDKIGNFSIHVGGTAHNVAVNLGVTSDRPIHLLTALKQSPIARMIVDEIRNHRVIPEIIYDETLGESGFSAHIVDGELLSAVSAVSVEDRVFSDRDVPQSLMDSAGCMILDCNLNEPSLNALSRIAHDNGLLVIACAVSQPKALRLPAVVSPHFVFLNKTEWAYLKAHRPDYSPSPETVIFVTHGDRGSIAVQRNEIIHSVDAEQAHEGMSPGNNIGCGDAYCAGVVSRLIADPDTIRDAMVNGSSAATSVIDCLNANTAREHLFSHHLHNLHRQIERDGLTGLYNRASGQQLLENCVTHAKAHQTALSVIFFDIDHFKQVNDTYGHGPGDEVIKMVSATASGAIRNSDMLARWGGEEFVIALADCDRANALRVAQTLREAIACNDAIPIPHRVSVSVGVTSFQSDDDALDLVQRADEALYKAKEGGRNQVQYT